MSLLNCCSFVEHSAAYSCRSPSGVEFLLDIEDYLRTPHYFSDFVEKFMILATNARQFMEWCRQLAETAARALGGDPKLSPPRLRLAEL